MKLEEKSILIISPEAWGTNFVSKHHYAQTLAKRGNKVYFLNPPSQGFDTKQANGVTIINYKPTIRGINILTLVIRNLLMKRDIKKIYSLLSIEKIDVVWSFDPYRFQNLSLFNSDLRIYHPVDVHNTNLEFEICKNADILFGISELILDKFKSIPLPKYKINHGLSHYFLGEKENDSLIKKTDIVNVGYVGNLHSKYLDTNILTQIINMHSTVHFYFIGPYGESNLSKKLLNSEFVNFIQKAENCFLLGSIPSNQLAGYIQKMDVFIMTYRSAQVSNTHKMLEYLSTGKVVVTQFIDEYRNRESLLAMVGSENELVDRFTEVIQNLSKYNATEVSKERVEYATENTYEKQIEKIENIVTNAFF